MNTANLQLEGLLLALSAVVGLLRRKGIVTDAELEAALGEAELAALTDEARPGGLSLANVEAVLFPIRYLRAAGKGLPHEAVLPFSRVATRVGQSKRDLRRPI
jgi:hypothetical protein